MPKEKFSLLGMLRGEEPGPIARILHNLHNKDEGEWGEICIEKLSKKRISNVHIFRNVYVPVKGETSEIDIIMIKSNGIYIFESKAYGGKIYGNPDHMNWIQYIGKKQNTFYNPIKQNEKHRQNLSYALLTPKKHIYSFVVFENRTDISRLEFLKEYALNVCNRNQLLALLKTIMQDKEPVFNETQIKNICLELQEWSKPDKKIKEQHIQHIQNKMFGDTCPICGKMLIERKGKYGPFFACTGYPSCKYTRQKKS